MQALLSRLPRSLPSGPMQIIGIVQVRVPLQVASNDFAIGFPVIDALYGDTYGMDAPDTASLGFCSGFRAYRV